MTERITADDMEMTYRTYLTIKATEFSGSLFQAMEAVATTALEHPEWDMEEMRTFSEWEAASDVGRKD